MAAANKGASQQDWVVTLAPGADPAATARALRGAGLAVQEVLGEIGVVLGRGPGTLGKALRQLPGVADVAGTVAADVGPPDAGIS